MEKRKGKLGIIVPVGIQVAVPARNYELIREAVCLYYKISEQELFDKSKSIKSSRRRGVLYYLTFSECMLSHSEIAEIYVTTRQSVTHIINTLTFELANYLPFSCECEDIKSIYAILQKEQNRWLDSHKTNMMP